MAAANIQDCVSDDFDYELWSPVVKTRLVKDGVWDVVQNGVSPNPTKIPELAATITVDDLAQWRNRVIKDNEALKIMQSYLPDSVFRKTISVASAKDLWDMLKEGNDNQEAKLRRLEKQFENLIMYEDEPMHVYLERILEIVDRFRGSGNAIPDDQVITKLLTSLSCSFDDAIPVLEELMNLPDMTLDVLIAVFGMYGSHPETMPHMLKDFIQSLKAKSEQMWCSICKKSNHNQEDCFGASQFSGQSFQCGERGHRSRDCSSTSNLQAEATQEAQIDQKKIQNPEHEVLVVTLGSHTFDEDMWMIYTSASNHMTPYKKFFTTLDRSYRARVGLGDGRVIMAQGNGEVMIMTKEGKKMTKNVLFVPGMDRNVLSVTQMADDGYSVIMGGGKCIIEDQSTGKVLGEAMWEERGYALRLEVINGDLW